MDSEDGPRPVYRKKGFFFSQASKMDSMSLLRKLSLAYGRCNCNFFLCNSYCMVLVYEITKWTVAVSGPITNCPPVDLDRMCFPRDIVIQQLFLTL